MGGLRTSTQTVFSFRFFSLIFFKWELVLWGPVPPHPRARGGPRSRRAPLAVSQSQYGQSKKIVGIFCPFFVCSDSLFFLDFFFGGFQHFPLMSTKSSKTTDFVIPTFPTLTCKDCSWLEDSRGKKTKKTKRNYCQKKKIEKKILLCDCRWTLAHCEWRAAAPGLKPLRLPRARVDFLSAFSYCCVNYISGCWVPNTN